MVLIFSMTGSEFVAICVFGCWLLSGRYAVKWRAVRNNPVALASLGIVLLTLVGCCYSTANRADLLKGLLDGRNYFVVVVCITLFDKAFYRDAAIAVFHLGAAVLLCLKIVLTARYGTQWASMAIVDYVTFGIAVVAWMLLILYRPFSWKQLWPAKESATAGERACLKCDSIVAGDLPFRFELKSGTITQLILVLLLIIYLLGANPGRTVYLCLLAVLGIIGIRNLRWKTIAMGSALVLAVLLIGTDFFPRFRERWTSAYLETAEFQADNSIVFGDRVSSVGTRLFLYKYGLKIVAEHPFFGTGTETSRRSSTNSVCPSIAKTTPYARPDR